jgi:hypothetical protein
MSETRKVAKYGLVTGANPGTFAEECQKWVTNGWTPVGPAQTCTNPEWQRNLHGVAIGDPCIFTQTFVKHEGQM